MDGIKLDIVNRKVWQREQEIMLTAKEFAILEYLARHANSTVTRVILEQHVWNEKLEIGSNTLDEHVLNLRKKLENPGLIQTLRGVGYRLKV